MPRYVKKRFTDSGYPGDYLEIRYDQGLGYVYVEGSERYSDGTVKITTERLTIGQAQDLANWILEVTRDG